MNYVRYIEIKNRRLSRVGCMKCNTFLYDLQDRVSLKAALDNNLPRHIAVNLSDGSYTDLVLCKSCDVVEADLPKLENSAKFAWLYEFISAGNSRDAILRIAKRLKTLKMLNRRETTCLTPTL